jgi:hypothetical protein
MTVPESTPVKQAGNNSVKSTEKQHAEQGPPFEEHKQEYKEQEPAI